MSSLVWEGFATTIENKIGEWGGTRGGGVRSQVVVQVNSYKIWILLPIKWATWLTICRLFKPWRKDSQNPLKNKIGEWEGTPVGGGKRSSRSPGRFLQDLNTVTNQMSSLVWEGFATTIENKIGEWGGTRGGGGGKKSSRSPGQFLQDLNTVTNQMSSLAHKMQAFQTMEEGFAKTRYNYWWVRRYTLTPM